MFSTQKLTARIDSLFSFSDVKVSRARCVNPRPRYSERKQSIGVQVATSKRDQAELMLAAKRAKRQAYALYSNFRVGAALLTNSGEIVEGCNVENSSYGLTMCAERNAVFHAVAKGARGFRSLAIASDDAGFLTPCGACRQVLAEFSPRMEIILTNAAGHKKITSLDRLFPIPPDLKKLSRRRSKSKK
jgi:cytidine deaminase